MDIRELTDLNIMYRRYMDKQAIDKQELIMILRRGDPPEHYGLTFSELAPLLADCLDDKVRYIPKHNKKEINAMQIMQLAWAIANNIHTKKKAPRESAFRDFAEKNDCTERHVRTAIRREISKADFEWQIGLAKDALARWEEDDQS